MYEDFYCSGGYLERDLCGVACDIGCVCYHRKYPTPEQFKKEYGREYEDWEAVYAFDDNFTYGEWEAMSLDCAKGGCDFIVCACTPHGKPPDDWRSEKMDVEKRRCRVCGCTDDDCRQCIEKTGGPCHWVENDLCSACADEMEKSKAAVCFGKEEKDGLVFPLCGFDGDISHYIHADGMLHGEVRESKFFLLPPPEKIGFSILFGRIDENCSL